MKKVKIFTIGIVILVFVVEVILRFSYKQKLAIRHYPPIYESVSGLGYKYRPKSEGIFTNPAFSYTMKINNQGWMDLDFDIDKKDKFRIVLMGASDVNGYSWFLKEKFLTPDSKIELLNCSIDGGFREVERIVYIKREIIKYDPDVVFFTGQVPFHSNEVYRSYYKGYQIVHGDLKLFEALSKYVQTEHIEPSIVNFLFDKSYSFRYLCKYYAENDNFFTTTITYLPLMNNKKAITEKVERVIRVGEFDNKRLLSTKETAEALIDINEFLNERNIKFVTSSLLMNEKLKSISDSLGIKYFSTNNEYDVKDTYGKADGHLTPEANKRMVEEYYKLLMKSDIISNKFKSIDISSP